MSPIVVGVSVKLKPGAGGTCPGGLKEDYAALGKESDPG